MSPIRYINIEQRLIFNSVLCPYSGCWIWTGKTVASKRRMASYGRLNLRIDGKHVAVLAHRLSYEVFIGPIPDTYEVDHYCCFETLCICPNHLRAVTPIVNKEAIRREPKTPHTSRAEFLRLSRSVSTL